MSRPCLSRRGKFSTSGRYSSAASKNEKVYTSLHVEPTSELAETFLFVDKRRKRLQSWDVAGKYLRQSRIPSSESYRIQQQLRNFPYTLCACIADADSLFHLQEVDFFLWVLRYRYSGTFLRKCIFNSVHFSSGNTLLHRIHYSQQES